MHRTTRRWLGPSLISALAVTALVGCGDDAAVGPDRRLASPEAAVEAPVSASHRLPDLTECDSLAVSAGNRLAARLYAEGVQIYRWSGTAWTFVEPSARLFAGKHGNGQVGTHYAGPTWESVSGSKVVGSVMRRCTPDANSIPWLLLGVVSSEGPGIFHGIKYIQRLNTAGGIAPIQPGSFTGETTSVPYTSEYLFYRAR